MKIEKNTMIEPSEVTNEALESIGRFATVALTPSDVFTFRAVLCDDQIDRDFEAFSSEALHQLAELFDGRTVIKDHTMSCDDQFARIYHTEVRTEGGIEQIVADCYMIRTDSNADLIREIQGGIKKEGSVSCSIASRKCSICGTDLMTSQCRHIPGRRYQGKTCYRILSDARDAYEFSLVAVPAQHRAGVSKAYETAGKDERARLRAKAAGLSYMFDDKEDT